MKKLFLLQVESGDYDYDQAVQVAGVTDNEKLAELWDKLTMRDVNFISEEIQLNDFEAIQKYLPSTPRAGTNRRAIYDKVMLLLSKTSD